jgi:hypothetical protein
MKISQCQNHTVVHKLDPAQFAALQHLAVLFLNLLGAGNDPATLAALTERLKASSDALEAAVKANQPKP